MGFICLFAAFRLTYIKKGAQICILSSNYLQLKENSCTFASSKG